MFAQPLSDTALETEVIYLLVPPKEERPRPRPSMGQRVHYRLWLLGQSEIWSLISSWIGAAGGAVVFACLCCVALYGVYYLKSMAGVDLVASKHLEDYVPVPGYGRW